MIYRLEVYDCQTTTQKHTYIWTEGAAYGYVIQHANKWIHPHYTFDMFLAVIERAFVRGDAALLFTWDGAYWKELD